jgi:molecular chaperone DnaJ
VRRKREITIKVPPGIEDSTRMRVAGEGEPSPDGGPPGDLYCDIFIRPHRFFARRGNDVLVEVPIPFATAAMGGEIDVPTIDGEGLLKVPRGTPSGQLLRIRKAGVPVLNGRGRGDQIVRVVVDVPRKMTKRQEELLREFADIEKREGGKKSLWERFFGEK